jgi:hypothetical protein
MKAEDFLNHERSKRARLIWCKEEDVQFFEDEAKEWGFTVKVNHDAIEDLRNLTPDDCLIVTKVHLMRGVDYHCKVHGIDLLVARDFPHTRAYVQGLGRVGRY